MGKIFCPELWGLKDIGYIYYVIKNKNILKTFKIKLYYKKRGNSYSERSLRQCMDIVLDKLGVDLMDYSYSNISKIDYIEECVKQAYDNRVNPREIIVTINLKTVRSF